MMSENVPDGLKKIKMIFGIVIGIAAGAFFYVVGAGPLSELIDDPVLGQAARIAVSALFAVIVFFSFRLGGGEGTGGDGGG